MIILKSDHEIQLMKTAGQATANLLHELERFIKPGISTMDIDRYAEQIITDYKMIPTFKGYGGFPASVCVSINHQVVHGIPSKDVILQEGDIISIDTGCTYRGYVSDAARTFGVGCISPQANKLIDTAKESFFEGLRYCKVGQRIGDISQAIQTHVESQGFGVVRELGGHGLGQDLHEDPPIPNFGKPGHGPRLQKGMALAIEPMITQGDFRVTMLGDDWTIVTTDGKLAAHYENTVIITDEEPLVLTLYEE